MIRECPLCDDYKEDLPVTALRNHFIGTHQMTIDDANNLLNLVSLDISPNPRWGEAKCADCKIIFNTRAQHTFCKERCGRCESARIRRKYSDFCKGGDNYR